MPQVQGYMELLDVPECDFVSYTQEGFNVFRIRRDRQYWDLLLPVLEVPCCWSIWSRHTRLTCRLQEFWVFLNQPHTENLVPPPEKHSNTEELLRRSKAMAWETPPECSSNDDVDW